MTHHDLVELLQMNPIISAISDIEDIDKALVAPSDIVFFLTGDIFSLTEQVARCKKHDKVVFLHLDLIKGFSRDAVSLKYLKETIRADGVISTKVTLLKEAKNEGFFIIQRLFMLDSTSFKNSIHAAKCLRPDIVEIMPGIMPKIISRTCQEIQVPVIASGLIDQKEEVIICLKAGATSVSTTNQELWYV